MNIDGPQAVLHSADEPRQLLGHAVVPVHRIGDVETEAAVQVVARVDGRQRFGREPVGGRVEVVVVEAPAGGQGGQVERAGGDVDVRDLARRRLEGRQRLPATLRRRPP
jgi:hypothetical protein